MGSKAPAAQEGGMQAGRAAHRARNEILKVSSVFGDTKGRNYATDQRMLHDVSVFDRYQQSPKPASAAVEGAVTGV